MALKPERVEEIFGTIDPDEIDELLEDEDELPEYFRQVVGRQPDKEDEAVGLASLIWTFLPH